MDMNIKSFLELFKKYTLAGLVFGGLILLSGWLFFELSEKNRELTAKDIVHNKELFNKSMENISEKFAHIDQVLSNHVTKTDKKIDRIESDIKEILKRLPLKE